MATDCMPQVTFEGEGFPKPVIARFDLPDASSDGGLVLLKAVDSQLGLTTRLAAPLDDGRQAGKVLHEVIELVQQRVFGLCAGYADCNDAARLAHCPARFERGSSGRVPAIPVSTTASVMPRPGCRAKRQGLDSVPGRPRAKGRPGSSGPMAFGSNGVATSS